MRYALSLQTDRSKSSQIFLIFELVCKMDSAYLARNQLQIEQCGLLSTGSVRNGTTLPTYAISERPVGEELCNASQYEARKETLIYGTTQKSDDDAWENKNHHPRQE